MPAPVLPSAPPANLSHAEEKTNAANFSSQIPHSSGQNQLPPSYEEALSLATKSSEQF